jgi:hypothetical protein
MHEQPHTAATLGGSCRCWVQAHPNRYWVSQHQVCRGGGLWLRWVACNPQCTRAMRGPLLLAACIPQHHKGVVAAKHPDAQRPGRLGLWGVSCPLRQL